MSPKLRALLIVGGLLGGAFVVYQIVSVATKKPKGMSGFLGQGKKRKFPKPKKYRRKVIC